MGGCNDGGRCVDMGGCNVDHPRRCNVGGCNVLISIPSTSTGIGRSIGSLRRFYNLQNVQTYNV
jgi:hypothetical protein